MTVPKITIDDINYAFDYIDKNGIPSQHESTKYELVTSEGKKYPPKYVIALAVSHVNKTDEIKTDDFNPSYANKKLQDMGFKIQLKQEEFTLTITNNNVFSTDNRFTMDNLDLGDNYKPLNVLFKKSDGSVINRLYSKGEYKISNQTMPKLACQVFEKKLAELSIEEKDNFPICKYRPSGKVFKGIFSSIEDFKKHINTLEFLRYHFGENGLFVFYCWNIFSTIIFVQECLKRFGDNGDQFILTYREKNENEKKNKKNDTSDVESDEKDINEAQQDNSQLNGYKNKYSKTLINAKNIILHGAPGTGKTYLAKEIAADVISDGNSNYNNLSLEQKKQIEFVQFHPNYDYSDFVEGLRPKVNGDGTMGFELQDGIFKRFISNARKNYEDSQKTKDIIEKEYYIQKYIIDFFSDLDYGEETFKTVKGNKFYITSVDDKLINIFIPDNPSINKISLNIENLKKLLGSNQGFTKVIDVGYFFGRNYSIQTDSYYLSIYKEIKAKANYNKNIKIEVEKEKKYVFIIDEINRGEISKIFGELFYSIDPGYRGKNSEISTQYQNLHPNPDEKFYIPENVYIIGTMNDIDRSVDSFDFAMRRRFRFIKINAKDSQIMLTTLDDELKKVAIERMNKLNEEINNVEDLNDNYQIGASYFLKLRNIDFNELWTDYLQPLLQEYIRGMYDEEGIMNKFTKAYGYNSPNNKAQNESTQD